MNAAESALADQQVYRDVIGRFASGVTVITTTVDGAPFGTTASAVSSLSLEPPMVLVCLNKSSDTQVALLKAGAFCVNILAEGQQDLAYQFARKGDKFAGIPYDAGIDEVPVLSGTLAHLECRTAETVTGGTHTVFLAHVAVAAGHDGAPLTYFRGRFGRLESVREEEAYRAVRDWVLTRRCALDRPLELADLARTLEHDPGHVAYALVRLADARTWLHAHHGLRAASHGYHCHFVGLGGSPQLVDTYRRWVSRRCGGGRSASRTGARGSTSRTTRR